MIVELQEKVKKLVSGSFFKNVTILMSGTAIAQGLAFAVSPVLSRLYDPSAFGLLGLFIAVISVISVAASAKYELAILLPKKDDDAANILWLSAGIITIVTIISLFLVLFYRKDIAKLMGSAELASLLWWAPACVLFSGLYNAFNYWTTRRKEYKRLSISRVIQTGGREGAQLGLGFFTSLQGSGLVWGYLFGQVCSASILIIQTFREDFKLIKNSFDKNRIKALALEHNNFAKFTAPQSVLNSLSQNVPAILLAYFFNPPVVGLYWFTYRILVAPNKLIGHSIRQVFYQRVNELRHEEKNVLNLFLRTTGSLALMGIVPLIALIFLGPTLFESIFGSVWYEAGQYAQWLSIWWFVGFINPPAIMMIPVLGLQKFQFLYEILLTAARVIVITIGGLKNSVIISIALFSIIGFFANTFLVLFVFYRVKMNR